MMRGERTAVDTLGTRGARATGRSVALVPDGSVGSGTRTLSCAGTVFLSGTKSLQVGSKAASVARQGCRVAIVEAHRFTLVASKRACLTNGELALAY